MITEIKTAAASNDLHATRELAVVNSALWAAAGDALGWITELSHGITGVARRAGTEVVTKPVEWKRIIGGRGGPRVDLPAGTYSDDTQLRLAVSRSIRGDGSFDPETFAKIEMTVWPTYALGAGLGSKAAAANLARRSVNWFSNFFDSQNQRYVSGGGNGAAMRIQPHIWSSANVSDETLRNVLRDALVTHGHPHGFCGAVFHALCLAHTFQSHRVPSPNDWHRMVDRFSDVGRLIKSDPHLAAFWQAAWENDSGVPIERAIDKMKDEARRDLQNAEKILEDQQADAYRILLDAIGCRSAEFRGSGFKTALAAAGLAYLHSGDTPAIALKIAANELESDTDTIATMTGALMGAVAPVAPDWALQDRAYIVEEAKRLAAISLGRPQDSFTYPDLGHWNPPAKQTASIGLFEERLAIAGLGSLTPTGQEYQVGDAIWQWFSLPFGQTVLAKRKANLMAKIAASQLPGARLPAKQVPGAGGRSVSVVQSSLALDAPSEQQFKESASQAHTHEALVSDKGIDAWTDEVIQSGFDDLTIGRLFNKCVEWTGSVDSAVAFAGIVAKAKLTRQRRRRS